MSTAAVVLAGALLSQRSWVSPTTVSELAKVTTGFMLPTFLFSNLSKTSLEQLRIGWVLPLFCIVHITLGLLLGKATSVLLRADWGPMAPTTTGKHFGSGIVALMAFGNATGLPLSLMPAIISQNPMLGTQTHAALCIALYGMFNKVGLWSVAAELLSSCKLDEEKRGTQPSVAYKMMTEPVNLAAAAGLAVGLTPPLNALFANGAPLGWLMSACDSIGKACFPLMTLLLGCNLAQGVSSDRVDLPSIGVVAAARLIVFPLLGMALSRLCLARGWLPDDPMIQFIILLETCVPTAMQMSSCAKGPQTRNAVSAMLLFQYAASAITMAVFIALFLQEVQGD